jgi:hypothetical protein
MLYPGVALLQAQGGHSLTFRRLGHGEAHLRLFLLGCGLAMICEQRGRLVLHAAALSRADEAVLLCGARGAGKSTTTAALMARGWKLVSDDVVALDGLQAAPAMPYLRLWPASLELLDRSLEAYPRLLPDQEKRRIPVNRAQFSSRPATVSMIVALEWGQPLCAQPLSFVPALMKLVSNSFNAAWGGGGFSPEMAATNFKLCSDVARRVPVYQLQRPFDQARMAAFLDLLEGLQPVVL